MRLLHIIAALLLVASALVLAAQPRAVAGSQPGIATHQMGHAQQHTKVALTTLDADESQQALEECRHGPGEQGSHHKPRPSCCSAPVSFGLLPGAVWTQAREAHPLDLVSPTVEPRVAAAHLRGIERPPRQG